MQPKIVSVIGCGNSAKEWFKTHCDLSIGVNDCVKFGHEVDYLVVVNAPLKFNPSQRNGHINRLKVITDSKPKKFLCHNSHWRKLMNGIDVELIAMQQFRGYFRVGRIYSTGTSPFIAITLAASKGAKEIILWGVDMITHKFYHAGNKEFDYELKKYKQLFEQLEQNGIKVWIGNENTVLKDILPLYEHNSIPK